MTEGDKTPDEELRYQRCRFTARIPRDRVYTRDHYWMKQQSRGVWRVGLTPWAVRMLGDFVELTFDVAEGAAVRLDQALGTLEAFKAVAEIRSVATGTFIAANPILHDNLDAITRDCYGQGWLYAIADEAEPDVCDAEEYRTVLDETIDDLRGNGPP
jgi:glycine cleavage system H protein